MAEGRGTIMLVGVVALAAWAAVSKPIAVQSYGQRPRVEAQQQAENRIGSNDEAKPAPTEPRGQPEYAHSSENASEVTFLGIKPGEYLLSFVTLLLFWATRDLVKDARETTKRQLRAYVHHGGFEPAVSIQSPASSVAPYVDCYVFWLTWKNFGKTPAKRAVVTFASTSFPMNDDRPEYRFEMDQTSDLGADIGPGSSIETKKMPIPIALLMECYMRQTEILLWCRIEYTDALEPKTRRYTESCARLDFIHDPRGIPPKDHPSYIMTHIWGPQNGST